jgi:D-alanyl-D-alanine carboxypeptidase
MKKPHLRRARRWMKKHLIGVIAIPVALILAGGFLYWYNAKTNTEVASIQSTASTNAAKTEAQIKSIAAAKAAALKAQQEAAAKAAQATTSSTVSTTASSCNNSTTHNDPSSIDVLVNKKHCIQPISFAPSDLVSIGDGYVLSAKAAPSYQAMMAAAHADGITLGITSSYRSYSDQVSTYDYWVSTSGVAGADTYSARPGYSEHQTGLAFDVDSGSCTLSCFGSTLAYTWMQQNANKYGFIQRYQAGEEAITGYEAEEWHYRYVGVAVAEDMATKGIKTLEEYWGISGGDYN